MTCAFCGEGIGVYDTVAVLGEESDRMTSLAMEPELRHADRGVMHAACAWFFREAPERPRIIPRPANPDAVEPAVASLRASRR